MTAQQNTTNIDPDNLEGDLDDPANMHSYRWTPETMRIFLEKVAESGSAKLAAYYAGKSRAAASSLRFRRDGLAFKLGWEAALLVARATLNDELMERSINGQSSVVERDEDGRVAGNHHKDNRLAMSMLSRLDRQCDAPVAGTDHALARIVAQDFEAFLDLISAGGTGAEAALFIDARRPPEPAEIRAHERCQLDGQDDPRTDAETAAGAAAAAGRAFAEAFGSPVAPDHPAFPYVQTCGVWWDDEAAELRTDFPPPDGFEGPETGEFGDLDYARALTTEEVALEEKAAEARWQEQRANAEYARKLWFGIPLDENEPETAPNAAESASPAREPALAAAG